MHGCWGGVVHTCTLELGNSPPPPTSTVFADATILMTSSRFSTGVITTPRKSKDCIVFGAFGGPYLNLHENLQLLETWKPGPPSGPPGSGGAGKVGP